MTEDLLIAWFMEHPMVRTILLMAITAIGPTAQHDWESFKNAKDADPAATFKVRVVARRYVRALLLLFVPVVVARLLMIIGGVPSL